MNRPPPPRLGGAPDGGRGGRRRAPRPCRAALAARGLAWPEPSWPEVLAFLRRGVAGRHVPVHPAHPGAVPRGRRPLRRHGPDQKQERERLQAQILQELREAVAEDEREDAQLGRRRGDELPPDLVDPQQRLARIREAMAALEAEAAGKAAGPPGAAERPAVQPASTPARTGRRGGPPSTPLPLLPQLDQPGASSAPPEPGPPPAVPADKAQYNFTDPESRIMRTSSKAFDQCYNAQLAVDASSQVITAAELTNQAADAPHLCPLVEQAIANTGWIPAGSPRTPATSRPKASRPSPPWRSTSSSLPGRCGIRSGARSAPRAAGRPGTWTSRAACGGASVPSSVATYALRQQTVEPVFGQIKWNRGLQQLLLRGLAAARASWRFECAVHNLLKLRRARLAPA